ncbi:lytic transglycosylase domain-containing protein [Albimonas sp. CAU 1670]|uniref:lytic transglycosylase domain-containing protein n=1 Tax=Albimonas sp. CAU 1670 TaxID=3032599 RepID=UPI0023DBBF4C|nr:lytic transglycosylase domain-containing protein [Albimonas sp. CAU 1670]MDF2235199.1 lytic transglycosylase domain-containing protein [Albimonas sp. CAU 1670]
MTPLRRFRRPAGILLATALLLSSTALPAAAFPSRSEGARFAPVAEAVRADEWASAFQYADAMRDPAAVDYVRWRWLAAGEGGFFDARDFLARNPDWPQTDRIRRDAEEKMPPNLRPAEVAAFFAQTAPLTGAGALALADAQLSEGRTDAARATVVRAWTQLSLTPDQEARLSAKWGGVLAPHHVERLDMLLWRGLTGEAERMLGRVDAAHQALARARISLRRGDAGVDTLVARVPSALAGDAGLAYERFRWREKHGLRDSAEQMMRERSTSAAALGRPSAWADERIDMVRADQRAGRYRQAYVLAAQHHLSPSDGYDYSELEWLSGWIALRWLNDSAAAQAHFARFIETVDTPISLGRGWYWMGRAREAAGDSSGAKKAYLEGARWQTSFYGQLAAERVGAGPDGSLTGVDAPTDWRSAAAIESNQVRAGVLLHWAGDRGRSHWLLTNAAAEATNPRDQAAIAHLALELDRPEVAVRAAKMAANGGIVLPTPYYPVVDLAEASGRVPPALALAIARQESEMNPEAISHAGARGLMQLMPGTAKLVAGRLGIGYDLGRLTADWRYNARLGTDYLAGLIDEFGSWPLAAAGYNAGPNRVRQWIAQFGDPRGGRLDMVDWIETIPFDETRNYVQRVMEGVHVYEQRLSGRPQTPELTALLKR